MIKNISIHMFNNSSNYLRIIFIFIFLISNQIKADDTNLAINNSAVIPTPQNFIFGYGSLVNSDSRKSTISTSNYAIPARISKKFGYVRTWGYRARGFTVLGIKKDKNSQTINGVIYPVLDNTGLEKWDRRESGYDRIEIPWDLISAASWQPLPKIGKVWVYAPKEENLKFPDYKNPLLQSYIDICLEGFLEYSEQYAIEFLETTNNWDKWWLNDRLLSRRPWVHNPEFYTIDNLLKQYPEDSNRNFYKFRAYAAEYDEVR